LQNRALLAEQETEKAYQEIDNLKKNYDQEIVSLNQRLTEYSQHNDATPQPAASSNLESAAIYDTVGGSTSEQPWQGELDAYRQHGSLEVTDLNSWFSGYDRCNI
jgi:kinesin family protein 15